MVSISKDKKLKGSFNGKSGKVRELDNEEIMKILSFSLSFGGEVV